MPSEQDVEATRSSRKGYFMSTTILRKLLIAGVAVTALSLAACGKKEEAAPPAPAR